jgi:hypothetical protein
MSSWSVRSVHCSRTGSGHMGATPQPKRTMASGDDQRRRFRKSGVSDVSESNQRSGESIDTVGVTGSIPVSPTDGGPVPGPPVISGSFSGRAGATRALAALDSYGSLVAPMWPGGQADVDDRALGAQPPRGPSPIDASDSRCLPVLDGEQPVRQ